ncbi:unnamed protein product [Somion occarium]|uniref:Uncharacterized protein n=1 Tax=Somion occarium TaxID=3059160 RepID=A0ABP1DCB9_9APHY
MRPPYRLFFLTLLVCGFYASSTVVYSISVLLTGHILVLLVPMLNPRLSLFSTLKVALAGGTIVGVIHGLIVCTYCIAWVILKGRDADVDALGREMTERYKRNKTLITIMIGGLSCTTCGPLGVAALQRWRFTKSSAEACLEIGSSRVESVMAKQGAKW